MPSHCEKIEEVPGQPITVSMQFDGNACAPGSHHPEHKLPNFTWEAEAESVTVHFGTLPFSSSTYLLLHFFIYNSPFLQTLLFVM